MNNEDWSLCVGIEHYRKNARLEALPGAREDARAMHAWLTSPDGGGVPLAQAKLIESRPSDPDGNWWPTTAEIELFLRGLYAGAAASRDRNEGFRAGRRLWLFYSGHGLGFPDDKDTGLLTADALLPDDVPHVAGNAWAEIFRMSGAFDQVVLFMDCCRTEANRIPLRRPTLRPQIADPEGRMMAAYAVAHSKVAYEVDVAGVPRGRFTSTLEAMLRSPPERPLGARRFLDLLEYRHPGLDPYPPRGAQNDFELLSGGGSEAGPAPPPSVLIAHGETTGDLAKRLAAALPSPAAVSWEGNVAAMPRDTLDPIRDLIVTRNLDVPALSALMHHVAPRRTIFLGKHDPGVSVLPGVRFVPRGDEAGDPLPRYTAEIERALGEFRGTLTVQALEAMTHLRVWNEDGYVVGEGYGRVRLDNLPVGGYRARGSLGPNHAEAEATVALGEESTLRLPPLVLAPTSKHEIASVTGNAGEAPRRESMRLTLAPGAISMSVPVVGGWTTQVFSTGPGATGLSVRMVPRGQETAALPTDSTREALRLALSAPVWRASVPTAAELQGDPITLLLAAALQLRSSGAADELTRAAAAILGDDDVDVRLLRGGAEVVDPPLLSCLWQHRLEKGALRVRAGSIADGLVGRRLTIEPWLSWTADEKVSNRSWLAQVADAAWPSWNESPDPKMALADLDSASVALGSPASSVRGLAHKAPPVDRLVQHERVAFVGASNDQLAAALAVAFVDRKHRRWEQIDVWFLNDTPLSSLSSAGRTGNRLLEARDRAEAQLRDLLKIVAKASSTRRYDQMELGGKPHFASLWDWTSPGGYVHVSARTPADVQTSPAENLVWSKGEPSPRYGQIVRAYEALQVSTPATGSE